MPLNERGAEIPSVSVNRSSAECYTQAQTNSCREECELLNQDEPAVTASVNEERAGGVETILRMDNVYFTSYHTVIHRGAITTLHAVFDASPHALSHLCQKDLQLKSSKLDAEVVQTLTVFRCQSTVTWKFVGKRIFRWGGWSERHPIHKSCIEAVIWEQQF